MGMLEALGTFISVFQEHADKDGDKLLSRSELKDLFSKEFGPIVGDASDKEAFDQLMDALDMNNDGAVDFKEFMTFVATFAIGIHGAFK